MGFKRSEIWFDISNFKMTITSVVFLVTISFTNSQNIGEVSHAVRLKYAGPCPTSDPSIFSLRVNSTPHRTTEYWNGFANVSENFLVDKVIFSAQKCGEGFYPCEKFVNIKTSAKDIKQFMYAKGQFWTPLWDAIHPQPELPMIHKNSFRIINATFDSTAFDRTIPEIYDHPWKIQVDVYSKNEVKHFCFNIDFSITKFRLRPIKKKHSLS